MRQRVVALVLGMCVAVSSTVSVSAQASRADGAILSSVLDAVKADDWARARATAARGSDGTLGVIAEWFRLAEGAGGWAAYQRFLNSYGDWPKISQVREHAERVMPSSLSSSDVIAFFGNQLPLTGRGSLKYSSALRSAGRAQDADAEILRAWRTLDLKGDELAVFRSQHARLVSSRMQERVDAVLWNRWPRNASDLLPYLSPEQAALARARIALIRRSKGVDKLIRAVPPSLASDPGLAYDRFEWRMKKGLRAEAAVLLLSRTGSAASLGRPESWAGRRLSLAHQAMREGRMQEAYRIASQHFLSAGSRFNELEWFAGWLALRKLNDASRALRHFERFQAGVQTPISLGRAGYWLGRAHAKLGSPRAARRAYEAAARYQTSYYGQLAAEEAGIAPDTALVATRSSDWRSGPASAEPMLRAAALFQAAGEPGRVWQFLTHMAAEPGQSANLGAIAQAALDFGRPHVAVRVAKIAARRGQVIMPAYYPLTPLAKFPSRLATEVALSIARQESEFNQIAVSPAGARGLMQLMPATAKLVARDLGISYSRGRLTSDWQYNAQLGTHYFQGLMSRFGNAIPLAAAGYNAGPHRVDRWVGQYGDPRTGRVDMIDWVETIPFAETRNYVMRVMEGLHVYRSRLAGRPAGLRLKADLGLGS